MNLGEPNLKYFDDNKVGLLVAFLYEFMATGFLVLIVWSLGVHQKLPVTIVGTCVGIYLTCGILCIGKWTGGALNPTRVFGPALVSGKLFESGWWVYYLGPILGGLTAAVGWDWLVEKSEDELKEETYKLQPHDSKNQDKEYELK